jgi:hypothetical protein
MVVYNDMIDARERAYAEQRPRADALLGSDSLSQLQAQRQQLENRFNAAVTSEDLAAFGTPQQREQWQRIQRVEAALADAPEAATLDAQDKLRLARGVLRWDLQQSWNVSVSAQRRELAELDRTLQQANARWLRVQQARQGAPANTGDFAQRIAVLQQRLGTLRAKLGEAASSQQNLLSDIAVGELQAQQQRISEYEMQARFALARIYDRAGDTPK